MKQESFVDKYIPYIGIIGQVTLGEQGGAMKIIKIWVENNFLLIGTIGAKKIKISKINNMKKSTQIFGISQMWKLVKHLI